MTIHAVQLDCVWEDTTANRERVRRLLAGRCFQLGDLIVLPEMFLTGFSLNTAVTAQSAEAADEQFLAALAVEHQCAVLGGVVTAAADGGCFNEAVTFGPDGALLGRYRKRRPFSLGGESQVHAAGDEAVVFDWGGFRVAPLICYDLRFPELAREAVAVGADLLIYIASWPIARVQHWLTLLQARAIENQAYVVGVNRCGRDPQFNYPGRSVVVDPHGVIIADAADREVVLSSPCEPAVVQDWRAFFPALRDAGLPV
jgi:omega-amidase